MLFMLSFFLSEKFLNNLTKNYFIREYYLQKIVFINEGRQDYFIKKGACEWRTYRLSIYISIVMKQQF